MRNRILLASVVGAAVLITGGLLASNMGFKLNKQLQKLGGASGTQVIAVPFNQQTSLTDAETLLNDISLCPSSNVLSVARYVRSLDGLSSYSCLGGENFTIAKGDAYYVKVATDQPYIVVGSHDPSFSVSLLKPAGASGTNPYAAPFHSVASTAEELLNEISLCPGSQVLSVARYVKSLDGLSSYSCLGGENFSLAPGEGYLIKVSTDVSFVPAHY